MNGLHEKEKECFERSLLPFWRWLLCTTQLQCTFGNENTDRLASIIANPFGFMSILFFRWFQDAYFETLIKTQRKLRQLSGNVASKRSRDGSVGIAWHEHSSNLCILASGWSRQRHFSRDTSFRMKTDIFFFQSESKGWFRVRQNTKNKGVCKFAF